MENSSPKVVVSMEDAATVNNSNPLMESQAKDGNAYCVDVEDCSDEMEVEAAKEEDECQDLELLELQQERDKWKEELRNARPLPPVRSDIIKRHITHRDILAAPMILVNLDTLTLDEVNGVDLPLCIAGPLLCMLSNLKCELQCRPEQAFFETVLNFFGRQRDPCVYRKIADWLIHTARLYSECSYLFSQGDSLFAFEIGMYVLGMITPKIFPISPSVAYLTDRIDLFCGLDPYLEFRRVSPRLSASNCEGTENLDNAFIYSEERQIYFMSIMNSYILHTAANVLDAGPPHIRDIVRFVFRVFQECYVEYVRRYYRDTSANDSLWSLHLMQKQNQRFRTILEALGYHVGKAIFQVPDEWRVDLVFTRRDVICEYLSIQDYEIALWKRLFSNLIIINSKEMFFSKYVIKPMLFHNSTGDNPLDCVCSLLSGWFDLTEGKSLHDL